MKVSLAQFGALPDKALNLRRISAFAEEAAKNGASMLFLPEYSMFYTKVNQRSLFQQAAEPLDGPFAAALSRLCRANGLWLACGLFEDAPDGGAPYNTAVVLDDTGKRRGSYRKQKLFDRGPQPESAALRAGGQPFEPIETPPGRLGVLTCYELRFPALAAEQKARGAELLYVPAGWMAGAHKALQWRTLLAARAIETGLPTLGVDQFARGLFTGCTAAFAPSGEPLGALTEGEALLTITL